jgi:hypothetical protein
MDRDATISGVVGTADPEPAITGGAARAVQFLFRKK